MERKDGKKCKQPGLSIAVYECVILKDNLAVIDKFIHYD